MIVSPSLFVSPTARLLRFSLSESRKNVRRCDRRTKRALPALRPRMHSSPCYPSRHSLHLPQRAPTSCGDSYEGPSSDAIASCLVHSTALGMKDYDPRGFLVICNAMKAAGEYVLVTTALTVLATPVAARTVLDCDVTEIIITSSPTGSTSVQKGGQLSFLVDDAPKTISFLDGKPLEVTRFDQAKINAHYNDIEFVFDRRDDALTYAGSSTKGSTTKTIIGSGHCKARPFKS